MPTFSNGESGESVRAKINAAIQQIEGFTSANLSYATLAEFEEAVANGLSVDDGASATANGIDYIAESGNTSLSPGLPGWRYADTEVKTQYERNADTNAFTDAEKAKLAGIEDGATAGLPTAGEVKTLYESNSNTNAYTDAEKTKLAGIESGATEDQTDAEIETAYNNQVAQVTSEERTAGTETAVRRFSPFDVATMAGLHGGSGSGSNDFAARAAFVSWAATESESDGSVIYADGTGYRKLAGATDIPDIDNWVPVNQTATPKHFGAVGDAQSSDTGAMASTSSTLTASSVFVSDDVGKVIKVEGAGPSGADLVTTISAYVSATEVTLTDAASTTVSSANFTFGTDDTDAIEASFAWIDNGEPLRENLGAVRNIFEIGVNRNVYFDPGFYIYNGAGVRMQNGAGRNIVVRGDDPSNVMISIFSDAFLIDLQVGDPAPNSIFFYGITVFGGKGLYLNRQTTSVPQGYQTFDRVRVLGHSEVAIASLWKDSPRWTITNSMIETDKPNTKGILCPPGFAHSKFYNTTIVGCTAKLVLSDNKNSLAIISGMTFFSLPTDDHICDVWIQPQDTGVHGFTNFGQGLTFSQNRFSSENRDGADVFLIADPDGVGDYWTQQPDLTATTNSLRDMQIIDNVMGGEGTADANSGPLVRSYTADLGAIRIADNAMNVGFSHLLYIEDSVSSAGRLPDAMLGPNYFYPTGSDAPLHCNLDVGQWRNSDGLEVFSTGAVLPSDGGWDHNYKLLSKDGSGNAVTMDDVVVGGSASATTSLPGPFEGSSGAMQATFTVADGSDYLQIPVTGIATIEAGQNFYVEFDLKAAANPVTEIDVEVLMTYSSGSSTVTRSAPVPTNWKRVRMPFRGNLALTGLRIRISPSSDGFSASTNDEVLVDNVLVYAANRIVNSGHNITVNSAWDAAHDISHEAGGQGEMHVWRDWANEKLMANFAAPTSATDGSLIPMMLNAGASRFFTPTLKGSGTDGTATYAGGGRNGYFFEIGNLVVGFGYMNWSGHTGTGDAIIDLDYAPEARDSSAGNRGAFICSFFSGFTIPASSTTITGFIERNKKQIGMRYRTSTADVGFPMAALASGQMNFMFAYEKA